MSSRTSLIAAIVWLTISTLLLTLPGSSFPREDWLSKIWFDKWVHIGMFAIMTFLWCRALPSKWHKQGYFLIVASLCFLYGVVMEFVQQDLVTNRSFDIGDIWADLAGVVIGFAYCSYRYIKK